MDSPRIKVPVEDAMRAASAIREKFTLSDPPDEEPRKQFCLSCGASLERNLPRMRQRRPRQPMNDKPTSRSDSLNFARSVADEILQHLKDNKEESKRDMSGLVAAFGYALRPNQIRLLLDQMVRNGVAERYGNGRRHCWRATVCRHGVAFGKICGKCETAMHGEPADTKRRRG